MHRSCGICRSAQIVVAFGLGFPGPRRKCPEPCRRYPEQRRRYPEQRRRCPEQLRRYPEQRRKYPEQRRRYPEQRRRYPEQLRRYPEQRRRYPERRRKYPEQRRTCSDLAARVPIRPAMENEIGKRAGFPVEDFGGEAKGGAVRSQTVCGHCFFQGFPVGLISQRVVASRSQEHCEVVIVAKLLAKVAHFSGQYLDRLRFVGPEQLQVIPEVFDPLAELV